MRRMPDTVSGDYTADCHFAVMENINLTVPWYLSTSLGYYEYDVSLISDHLYDTLCQMLVLHWDNIEHRHKHLIDLEVVKAGSGFTLREEHLPNIVVVSTTQMIIEYNRRLNRHVKA